MKINNVNRKYLIATITLIDSFHCIQQHNNEHLYYSFITHGQHSKDQLRNITKCNKYIPNNCKHKIEHITKYQRNPELLVLFSNIVHSFSYYNCLLKVKSEETFNKLVKLIIRIEYSKAIRLLICTRINDQYEQTWHSSIPAHIRRSYYILFKDNRKLEPYLYKLSTSIRKYLSKFICKSNYMLVSKVYKHTDT